MKLLLFYFLTLAGITYCVEGAAPKPVITHHPANEGVLLQCEVQGVSLKPQVFWKDRDGNILPAEEPEVTENKGRYSIILKTTVTKTDHYRCVSTQEEIHHEVSTETYVFGPAPKPVITRHQANERVLLQCVVEGASPKPKVVWKDRAGNILPAEEPEVTENEGRYNIILNTTVTKTDNYSCVATQEEISHEVYSETHVSVPVPAPKPVITHHQTNEGVLLQCEVRGASPKPKVVWKDGAGKILPAEEPEVTENEGRYNIILNTTVTKTNNYSCVATQEEINHEVYTETHVSVPVPAPKPVITRHPVNEGVLLQCEVRGASPKPKVVWKDRAGNILPAKEPEVTENKGKYNIILKTTVTKTDYYRCVSTQEEISHEVYTETYVLVPDPPGPNTGWIVGGVVGGVALLILVIVVALYIKRKCEDNSEESRPLPSGRGDIL